MRFALFAVLAFACLTNVYSHPTPNRVRRASSSASASSSSGDFGAGRIGGSGCSGFGCGIQFGDFFPAFGQLFNNYDAGFSNEQQSPYYPQDFARMGGNPQIYFPPGSGSSSSSSSSSSNNNGNVVGQTDTFSNVNGISSRISTTRDSSGRVTTVQGGSGVPDTITTRVLKPGQSFGVYSQSGVQVNPDGNVSSYRKAGEY